MDLSDRDLDGLIAWRRALHRRPELSGEEAETAVRVRERLADSAPDRILSGLGGHGVAAVFDGAEPGPTVMIRAELDGLPIEDLGPVDHRSAVPGKGHLCGHDGHMATLAGVALGLSRRRPARGRAVLMFQPAEEDGSGAAAVIADPRYPEIAPDLAFALHNLPGVPLGHVALREGPVNCASRGMRVVLSGKTAHSSMPETGVSPAAAVARLMPELTALSAGAPEDDGFALATVAHVRMGVPAFGVAPGRAEVWVTLRTLRDEGMDDLCARAEALVETAAAASGLSLEIAYAEAFLNCENDPVCVGHLRAALDAEGVLHDENSLPMRASEDFGHFGKGGRSAMFFLGSGVDHPQLHNPDYDFPDELIGIGARVFTRVLRDLLG